MTSIVGLVGCVLNTIILLYNLAKIVRGALQCLLEKVDSICLLCKGHAATHSHCVLHHISHKVPLEAIRRGGDEACRREASSKMSKDGSSHSLRLCFSVDSTTTAETVELGT